jgi:hypothetical protein
VGTESMRLRIRTSGVLCEHGSRRSGSTNSGEFLDMLGKHTFSGRTLIHGVGYLALRVKWCCIAFAKHTYPYSWQQSYEVPNEMTIVPGYWICSVAESTEGQNEGDTVQSKLWGEVLEQRERWCTKPETVVQWPRLSSVSGCLSGTGT